MLDRPFEPQERPTEVGLLLLPSFSLLGVIAAIDVMRHANRLSGQRLYQWKTFSSEGDAVQSSNGLLLNVDGAPDMSLVPDFLFVCGGFNPERFKHPAVFKWLRHLARQRPEAVPVALGGLPPKNSCTQPRHQARDTPITTSRAAAATHLANPRRR